MEISLFKRITREDGRILINGHFSPLNLFNRRKRKFKDEQHTLTFESNENLWNSINNEYIRSGHRIFLEEFFVMEWIPRSPGVFFTRSGENLRRYAEEHVIPDRISRDISFGGKYTVYDPHGKISLLKGGVGCIRLKSVVINGAKFWIFTATSNAVAHEGLPIALTDDAYNYLIDEISHMGAALCNVSGFLDFAPDNLVPLYRGENTPQLLMYVDKIVKTRVVKDFSPEVTAAVMFRSDYEGRPSHYASFVTFDPSRKVEISVAVDWLQSQYVKSMYKGEILLDFDEQMRRFPSARFSLKDILSGDIEDDELLELLNGLVSDSTAARFLSSYRRVVIAREGSTVIMPNKMINIGNGNTISAPVVMADTIKDSFTAIAESQAPLNLRQLLETLVADSAKLPPDHNGKKVVGDINMAVKELTREDPDSDIATRYLNKAKSVATDIGDVATPLISIIEKVTRLLG